MNDTNFTENKKDFGFDIVLPSHLVLNNSISSTTKLLYGLIRNLTRVEGYCYARNSYLAECMGMKERRIQEMLSELEKHGYIEKEVDDLNFNKTRKIFISNNFIKNISENKKVLTSCTKMHGGVQKNAPIKKIVIKKIEDCSVEGGGPPSVLKEGDPVEEKKIVFIKNSFGEILEISKQVMIEKSIQKRKDWQLSEIEEAWTILCSQNVINDPIKFLEGTINILRKKKSIQSLNKLETKKGPTCQNYLKKPSEDQMQAVRARLASGTEMHLWQAQL